jgi:hypothetical protein
MPDDDIFGGPLPTLHPRFRIVETAKTELLSAYAEICKRHNLTCVEALMIPDGLTSTTLKYMLRQERHPDNPDKPADTE